KKPKLNQNRLHLATARIPRVMRAERPRRPQLKSFGKRALTLHPSKEAVKTGGLPKKMPKTQLNPHRNLLKRPTRYHPPLFLLSAVHVMSAGKRCLHCGKPSPKGW